MTTSPQEPIKDLLRRKRGDRGQKEMASKLGVPVKTYECWERGENPPHRFRLPEIMKRLNEL